MNNGYTDYERSFIKSAFYTKKETQKLYYIITHVK